MQYNALSALQRRFVHGLPAPLNSPFYDGRGAFSFDRWQKRWQCSNTVGILF